MIDWKKTEDGYPEDLVPVILFVNEDVGRVGYRKNGKWYVDGSPWVEVDYWAYYTSPEKKPKKKYKSTL